MSDINQENKPYNLPSLTNIDKFYLGFIILFICFHSKIEDIIGKFIVTPYIAWFDPGWFTSVCIIIFGIILAAYHFKGKKYFPPTLRNILYISPVFLVSLYYRLFNTDTWIFYKIEWLPSLSYVDLLLIIVFVILFVSGILYKLEQKAARSNSEENNSKPQETKAPQQLVEETFYEKEIVQTTKEDTLRRGSFCKHIANLITNYNSKESLSIGIYGKWGLGKTAVLNMIVSELEQNDKLIVCRFNPWRYSTRDDMRSGYWKTLRSVLKHEPLKEQISKALIEFGSIISGTPYINISSIGKSIAPSAEELRKHLDTEMSKLNKHIVIVIDDVDRLPFNHINELMSLVKLNADLPNIIYLIALDKEIVNKIISKEYREADSNHNYLEKIIQVPILLPKILSEELERYFYNEIVDAFSEEDKLTLTKEIQSISIFYERLVFTINDITLRSIENYAQRILVLYTLLKGEVNLKDLLLLTILEVYYNPLYLYIKDNKELMLGDSKKKNVVEQFLKIQEYGDVYSSIKHLFSELFPKIMNWGIDDSHAKSNKRICVDIYFDRYFSYNTPTNVLLDSEIDEFKSELDLQNLAHLTEKYRIPITKDQNSQNLIRIETLAIEFSKAINTLEAKKRTKTMLRLILSIYNDFPEKGRYAVFTLQNKYRILFVRIVLLAGLTADEVMQILDEANNLELTEDIILKFGELETITDKSFPKIERPFVNALIAEYYARVRAVKKDIKKADLWFLQPELESVPLIKRLKETNSKTKDIIENTIKEKPKYTLDVLLNCQSRVIHPVTKKLAGRIALKANKLDEIAVYMNLDEFKNLLVQEYPEEVEKQASFGEGPARINSRDEDVIAQFIHLYNERENNKQ